MRLIELVTTAAMITASMAAPVPERESGRLAKRIDLSVLSDLASAAGTALSKTSKPNSQNSRNSQNSKGSSRSELLSRLGASNYQSSGARYSTGAKPDFLSEVAKNVNKLTGKTRLDSTYDPDDPTTWDSSSYGSGYGSGYGRGYGSDPSDYLTSSTANYGSSSSTRGRTTSTFGAPNSYVIPPSNIPPQKANTANNAATLPGGSTAGSVLAGGAEDPSSLALASTRAAMEGSTDGSGMSGFDESMAAGLTQ